MVWSFKATTVGGCVQDSRKAGRKMRFASFWAGFLAGILETFDLTSLKELSPTGWRNQCLTREFSTLLALLCRQIGLGEAFGGGCKDFGCQ
jgi:hypothetical protein